MLKTCKKPATKAGKEKEVDKVMTLKGLRLPRPSSLLACLEGCAA